MTIPVVVYSMNGAKAADIPANKAVSADIVLKKVTSVHKLGAQLTNAEWMNSMPGNGAGCVNCHSVQRIVNSTHTAEEWMEIIPRMATYSNGSTPETPQPIVPGPRQENAAPRNPAVIKRT